jgi:hypothetical protein
MGWPKSTATTVRQRRWPPLRWSSKRWECTLKMQIDDHMTGTSHWRGPSRVIARGSPRSCGAAALLLPSPPLPLRTARCCDDGLVSREHCWMLVRRVPRRGGVRLASRARREAGGSSNPIFVGGCTGERCEHAGGGNGRRGGEEAEDLGARDLLAAGACPCGSGARREPATSSASSTSPQAPAEPHSRTN